MSITTRDLLSSSLRVIGALASGETLLANESTDALTGLNQLLDSWSTENLLIPNKAREVFPLVSSQGVYTMGTGGTFNTTRPMRIENAELQITSSNPAIEIPIKILTKDEYARILLKTMTSTYPLYLYAEGTYPLETINLWPVPVQVNNLALYSWKPLANVSNLSTALSLPPGYERALKYNLAIDLAPEYGRPVTAEVAAIAVESKAAIKRMNSKPQYLAVDDALRARPAVFNWMTGEPT